MDVRTQVDKLDYAEQYHREEYSEKSGIFTFDCHDTIKLTHDGTPVLE